MADLEVRVEGLDALLKRADGHVLLGPPLRRFFDAALLEVQHQVVPLMPRWHGDLQRSAAREVDSAVIPQWGKFGTTKVYGPAMNWGRTAGAAMPPVAALEPWARAHGITNVFLLARSIGRKGTKPIRFMERGFAAARPTLERLVADTARAIGAQWRG